MRRALALPACLVATWAAAACTGPAPDAAAGATVMLDRAQLARALDDAGACRSPDASRGMWATPVRMLQASTVSVLPDGRVLAFDVADGVLRVYAADGAVVATLGRRGSGPGEFGRFVSMFRWPGDTIAAYDFEAGRISLFTTSGFARAITFGAEQRLAGTQFVGLLDDGTLFFATRQGFGPEVTESGRVRLPRSILRWREGAPPAVMRDGILGTESYVIRGDGGMAVTAANFARGTLIAPLSRYVAVFDNATNRIEFLAADGPLHHTVVLGIEDPPVSAEDRDRLLQQRTAGGGSDRFREAYEAFPERRPAVATSGADAAGGLWLRFDPPVSTGGSVWVRLAADGTPDRCYREPATGDVRFLDARAAVIVTTEATGDALNLQRTVPFPAVR